MAHKIPSLEISIRFSPPSDPRESNSSVFDELLQLNIQPNLNSIQCDQPNLEYLITVAQAQVELVLNILKEQCCPFEMLDESDATVHTLPWFPRSLNDLDTNSKNIFTFGVELDSDHPGFSDAIYRERRLEIAALTAEFKMGAAIPYIKYTDDELRTWNACFTNLLQLYPTHACAKYNEIRQDMFSKCGYRVDNVPRLEDVSKYVQSRSGFRIRPVGGLLSPRAFLAGLAFKVYHATQYMRHHSRPFYTPEPDICHELLGHLPLFADPQFADFVHQIGMASLGAPDEYTERLSACLWFTVEFGLCREPDGQLRAYGGGLLSSVDELRYALSGRPEVRDFEPIATSEQAYTITEFQPVYYATQSIQKLRDQMIEFADTIPRPFTVQFDSATDRMLIAEKRCK